VREICTMRLNGRGDWRRPYGETREALSEENGGATDRSILRGTAPVLDPTI